MLANDLPPSHALCDRVDSRSIEGSRLRDMTVRERGRAENAHQRTQLAVIAATRIESS